VTAVFVIATFALSWALWLALPGDSQWRFLPGTWMPAVVALGLTAFSGGRPALESLVGRVFAWRASVRWYLFALLFMAAIKLAAAAGLRAISGAWPQFASLGTMLLMPFAIAASTPMQAGEELGWRGFLLPRLAERIGLGPASLVVGVVWASWHLPLFYVRGGDLIGQSIPMFALAVTALSVAFARLYGSTGGSLLLAMLMHAAVNNTAVLVSSSKPMGWLTVLALWIVAAYFFARLRPVGVASRG
jgi:membrane protease YdiL (CAAX protease family)